MEPDPSRFIVLREGAGRGQIIEAESVEAAAREAARGCSIAGLRKGERITVCPVVDSTVFVARYDDPDWKWNGHRGAGPLKPVKVVVSRAA